jgi:hypothetical protein
MRMCAILSCGLLAGCMNFYDPPVKADHDAPKYEADLDKCRKQVNLPAGRINNATVAKAIASQFKSSDPQRHDIEICMNGKGYPTE